MVTRCGRICLGNKKINFSQVFAGQAVGIKEVHDDIWLVSFLQYDLGYFALESRVLEPLENPFGPKVLPMSPGRTFRIWWPGTELNRRRQPFQVFFEPKPFFIQQLNPSRWPIYCDHSVTSADVRLTRPKALNENT